LASASGDVPEFPWIYPYAEDPSGDSRYDDDPQRSLIRPLVEISLVGKDVLEQKIPAIVDSGSEHTLVAPWVGQAIGLEARDAHRTSVIGMGGDNVEARFVHARMRLHPPDGGIDDFLEWETEIGIATKSRATWSAVLGQLGFFDQFTVSMHRSARALAIEAWETFDQRFGSRVEEAQERRRRFRI
jgi:hypothetical protein